MLEYANVDSPVVKSGWKEAAPETRLKLVVDALVENALFEVLVPSQARDDGQVYLAMSRTLGASERGILLRAAEAHLKDRVDQGITVWCEPLGDKNSLRKLRGIQVLS